MLGRDRPAMPQPGAQESGASARPRSERRYATVLRNIAATTVIAWLAFLLLRQPLRTIRFPRDVVAIGCRDWAVCGRHSASARFQEVCLIELVPRRGIQMLYLGSPRDTAIPLKSIESGRFPMPRGSTMPHGALDVGGG